MESSAEKKDLEQSSTNVAPIVDQDTDASTLGDKKPVPLNIKILSVVIVSMIGFGGHWSSGVTGALKSTLKKASCLYSIIPLHGN
jgi:hypothetical protein